ncbi:sugar kinase [Clostridiales bacterium COT073_COT-073]|nr:sugar kinase [Clostridiales bacterium COT073_COT-073]
MLNENIKFVVVTRQTALEELVQKYNTLEQARFYITHLGEDFEMYQTQHQRYYQSLEETLRAINQFGKFQKLDRRYLPNFIFGEKDIIVVVGQDGLVANTMKYLENQKIIAVNPDKKLWDGILLPFEPESIKKLLPEVIRGKRNVKEITMAKAVLTDGQCLYAVNDLFIGPKSHTSARYRLNFDNISEEQSSSGIIISTGLGSTGWLKSIMCGALGITKKVENFQDSFLERNNYILPNLAWNSKSLIFSVREPFPSKNSTSECIFGEIKENKPLTIVSKMPENGVIFSDGIESDFLAFSSGMQASITIADRVGHLVV